MKLLNLDDIALDSERKVTFQGNTYVVKDFDVEEFIKFQKLFTEFRKIFNSSNPDDLDQIVAVVQKIAAVGVPDIDPDLIGRMNPMQMMAFVSLIANLLPEPDAETKQVIEEKKE